MSIRHFSLLNLLMLAFAAAALLTAYRYRSDLIASQHQVAALELELGEARPVPFSAVRFQIMMATQDVTSTDVSGIVYDPFRDQYSVQFAWTDPKTKKLVGTGITFFPDGAGRYTGRILSPPFATLETDPEGNQRSIPYSVTIKDPITRLNDIVVDAGGEPIQNDNWRTKR